MTAWERLVKARLLDKFEKLLPAYAGTNGCDNLQSKQLFQEEWEKRNLDNAGTGSSCQPGGWG